jgi:hypothetical protein
MWWIRQSFGSGRVVMELEFFAWCRCKFIISVVIRSFLVKDLLQVLIGDATIIHWRLVILFYYQLRGRFSLVLHYDYSRLVNLISKSRAIDQIWWAIPFVVILLLLLLLSLCTSLMPLITFIGTSTFIMIGPYKKVIRQQNWRCPLTYISFRSILEDLLVS